MNVTVEKSVRRWYGGDDCNGCLEIWKSNFKPCTAYCKKRW